MISKKTNFFSIFFLTAFFLISFHFIIRDSLFFYTDKSYILYYLFISSLILLPFFLIFFLLILKEDSFSENFFKFIIFLIIINFFRSIYFFFENKIESFFFEIIIFFISIIFSVFILSKLNQEKFFSLKIILIINLFSKIFFLIALINFLYLVYELNFKKFFQVTKKHSPVVIIFIDGLPKTFIRNFSENKNDINIIDERLKKNYVVQNYHKFISPAPWTCGFFANLYSISPADTFRRNKNFNGILLKKTDNINFFNKLDNLKINYTLAVSHSCAVPEGTAAAISNYKGYKSVLNSLSFYKIYLQKIGLPAHLIISMQAFKGDPTAVHLKDHSVLKKIINTFADSGEFSFQENIFNTLEILNRDLYIIHLNYSDWKYDDLNNFRKPINSMIKEVNKFFEEIKNNNNFDDFNFIITADHGFSFHKGDFGYGTSYRSEVIEIPFVIVKKKIKETAHLNNLYNYYQPCSVTDFQNSLLDYFEKKKNLLFVECTKNSKTSLTLPDHNKKKWVLTVYNGSKINTYNLYEQYFNKKNQKIFNNLNKDIESLLRQYSILNKNVF
jgi:hypothetical protein